MHDMEIIDPTTRHAAVNSLILFDLAKRAERLADPYHGLGDMYHAAEVSFARGDFHRMMTAGRPPGTTGQVNVPALVATRVHLEIDLTGHHNAIAVDGPH